MPELPDVQLYVNALTEKLAGERIEAFQMRSPFLLRSYEPRLEEVIPRTIRQFSRIGKRIVWHLEEEVFFVFHLMIAGRYHWRKAGSRPSKKTDLLALHFGDMGTLMLTEAGSKKRASMHIIVGRDSLAEHDPGGLEVLGCSVAELEQALAKRNHTLKRAMTDPHILSGIGNAYSDEILHRAGMSPFKLTRKLKTAEVAVLHQAMQETLTYWIDHLEEQRAGKFPEKVTAFRPGMAVHGRFGEPCPNCQTAVQKIQYADTEMNYCPRCQTDGKMFADRALSQILREDWPKTIDEMEDRFPDRGA